MIHILFGLAASGSMKYVLHQNNLEEKESIIPLDDIFSIGPIWQLHSDSGRQHRIDWFKATMSSMFEDDFSFSTERIKRIPDNSSVTIWISDNAHEQVGLRLAIYLLKDKNIHITVRNVSTLSKKLLTIDYTPRSVGEIAPEKLQLMYNADCCEPLTIQDRDILVKEWEILAESRHLLRVWKNGEIISVEENYYDKLIILTAKQLHEKSDEQFIHVARLIGELIGNLEQNIGDSFFEYRIRKLIEDGRIEMGGEFEKSRFYLVRLKG